MIAMVSDVKISRRDRYAALTCEAVLDAAKTLFVSNGFDATSVDEIARVAQSSKGAVYTISATSARSSPNCSAPAKKRSPRKSSTQ
jgi:hypothetical protein